MKNISRKLFGVILCVALAVALMAVSVFADSNSSQGKRGDKQGTPRSKDGVMVLSQIKDKIVALDDKETQADLTKLLQAYEDALAAEKAALEATSSATQDALDTQKKATADARSALASALSKSGIDIMDSRPNDEKNIGNRGGKNDFAFQTLDTQVVEKLIANLDKDKQANLTELLAAYKDALTAEKTSMSNTTLTEDEKKSLHEMVTMKAEKLTDALTNAGIKKSEYTHRANNTDGSAPEASPEQAGDASSSSDSSASNPSAKVGVLQGFINWLGSWIK